MLDEVLVLEELLLPELVLPVPSVLVEDDPRPLPLLSSVAFFHQSAARFFHHPLPAKPAQSDPPEASPSDELLLPVLPSLLLLPPPSKCKCSSGGDLSCRCTRTGGALLLLLLT